MVLRNAVTISLYSSTKYHSEDKIEKNVMGGARSKNEGQVRCVQGFGGET